MKNSATKTSESGESPTGRIDAKYIERDIVHRLESAYTHMCQTMSENMNNIKSELSEVKNEIRKIPVKISDIFKRENKSVIKCVADLQAAVSECDNYKQTVVNLTTQLQHQSQEMWKMQRMLAAYHRPAGGYSPAMQPTRDAPPRPSTSPSHHPDDTAQGNALTLTSSHQVPQANTPSPRHTPPAVPPNMMQVERQVPVRPVTQISNTAPHPVVTHSPQAQQMSPAPAQDGVSPHENAQLPRDQIISQTEQVAQRAGNRSQTSVSDYEGTGPTGTEESSESDSEVDIRDQQRPKRKLQCDALLIGDSTVKYVDKQRLLGRNMRSYIQRASTTAVVKENTLSWQRDSDVKYVVVHNGVNDVRGGKSPEYIVENLTESLTQLKMTFPNAKLCYSEMLYVGCEQSNPSLNTKVKAVNEKMISLCAENDMLFIPHTSLQTGGDDLFDDDVHIGREGGTAVFVSDVHRAVGLHRNRRPHEKDSGRQTQRYNANDYNRKPLRGSQYNGKDTSQNSPANWEQLYQLMLLNMMRNFGE